MKQLSLFFITSTMLLLVSACEKEKLQTPETMTYPVELRDAVTIPAGSVDALAAALAQSSTVILEAGLHTETQGVTVSGYHRIIGQPGAVLRIASAPSTSYPLLCNPALHLKNAGNSTIQGIKIEPADAIGGTAILVENSPKAVVQQCEISQFQFGIVVEKSSLTTIFKNKLSVTDAWQSGGVPEAHGIVVMNGQNCKVEYNEVSGALFGIWACDKNGKCFRNNLHDNYLGIILCKVPLGSFELPGGEVTGAVYSCGNWTVRRNNSHHNLTTGYLVIDGANKNLVEHNVAESNGTYDYELVGDSYRFGFLTPFCFDNTVRVGDGNTVKDCGQNNMVVGGVWIDTNTDPCN